MLSELERGERGGTPQTLADYQAGANRCSRRVATLIYTSGTTESERRHVTHNNIRSNCRGTRPLLPMSRVISRSLSPATHIFERMGDYLMWATGVSIA